jgi:glycosyltransferase involved in cell wall biosynthesis
MKILHLSYAMVPDYNDPDEWFVRIGFFTGVLRALATEHEVVSVHCINYSGFVKNNGVSYRFFCTSRWQQILPFRIHRFVKEFIPDAVIVHGLIFPWQVILLRFQLGSGVKIIAQHHAERPFGDIRQFLQKWADRYTSAYLFASSDLGKLWVERGQIESIGKVKIVMGTSSPFYPVEKQKARSITGVSGEPVYLWVGGLDDNKDPLTVVRAFIRFCRSSKKARLYMIYQTFQLLDEVKACVADSGEAICLVGKVNNAELLHWYNSADFIISSSHYEGSGIAVCEALSCGCIPLLTDIPSFRMMTDNGRLGLLYTAGDMEALLNCLNKSVKLDREEFSGSILEYFSNELSFDANARKIVEVINEIDK